MPSGLFVAYYRVSTIGQGRSGLGLEAQVAAVKSYLNGGNWSLVAEFTEVESGAHNDRAQLGAALAHCRLTGARLVIAKLDRLARNAAFLLGLRDSGVDFVAADMPEANRLTVGIMAVVAEAERDMISARTKAALAAAKARGTVLGGYRGQAAPSSQEGNAAQVAQADAFAARVAPTVRELAAAGKSLRQIATELTARHISTARGGAWTATAVKNLLARVA